MLQNVGHFFASKSIVHNNLARKPGGKEGSDELAFVCTYTNFKNLAHRPSGTLSGHGIRVFRLDKETGALTFLHDYKSKACMNPSFVRFHENKPIFYTCTESIDENGHILAYRYSPKGELTLIDDKEAHGKSTCYLTLSEDKMLAVNYWDSKIPVMSMKANGSFASAKKDQTWQPDELHVAGDQKDHLQDRQSEPHAHCLEIKEISGQKMAFVPDLGRDIIRQFVFDGEGLKEVDHVPLSKGSGPRYIKFHKNLDRAYVINELSNRIEVFAVLKEADKETGSYLKPLEALSTLPEGFTQKSTGSGIAIHPSQKWLLASNRGHDSIAVFKISETGELSKPKVFLTHGKTPRHFQFDGEGRFIIAANQDSDNLSVFSFNEKSGEAIFLKEYDCPSPNYVGMRAYV